VELTSSQALLDQAAFVRSHELTVVVLFEVVWGVNSASANSCLLSVMVIIVVDLAYLGYGPSTTLLSASPARSLECIVCGRVLGPRKELIALGKDDLELLLEYAYPVPIFATHSRHVKGTILSTAHQVRSAD